MNKIGLPHPGTSPEGAMMLDDICEAALLLATEEDAGLWQVLWEANSIAPELDAAERRRTVARVVSALAQHGLITVAWSGWNGRDQRPVPPQRVEHVVRDDAYWEPPGPGGPALAINVTEKGEAHYAGPLRGRWIFDES